MDPAPAGVPGDEAETVHLEIIDDLTETLGEEACEGLEFSGRRVTEGGTRVLLEVRDEEESGDDDDDGVRLHLALTTRLHGS